MSNSQVAPALTAAEWARVREENIRENALERIARGYYFYTDRRNENGVYSPRPDEDHYAAAMAFANYLLHDGHPLKITRAMVDALQEIARNGDWYGVADV